MQQVSPRTFTDVLDISNSLSIPRRNHTASNGSPTVDRIIIIATKLAAGTPATPTDVSKAIKRIKN